MTRKVSTLPVPEKDTAAIATFDLNSRVFAQLSSDEGLTPVQVLRRIEPYNCNLIEVRDALKALVKEGLSTSSSEDFFTTYLKVPSAPKRAKS